MSKPAITRALDRLGELDLARRKVDPLDRRSVLVQRTTKGAAFLRDLRGVMTEASGDGKEAEKKAGLDLTKMVILPRRGRYPPSLLPADQLEFNLY